MPPVLPLIDNSSRTAIEPAVSAAYGHTVPPARAGYTSTRTILDPLEARPAVFLNDPAILVTGDFPGQLRRWQTKDKTATGTAILH